ncbi:Gfo/Idh/MocA family oxidoreductase [Maribellus maritimus]|uniref:Gfo/Idh/MocA family oxidoreductase n=1 Tax=Maribellus maritimus TaxID=2870838 RepID=UPI001EEC032A|nr:Gfo/Idh/MocA family oxidoreductase [Maribellus maritimus]MCG6186732.1 Gfo/Idh/MocA family oxidoreductase [Maribellus maritimus]
MKSSRRKFIKTTGKGVAIASFATPGFITKAVFAKPQEQKLVIGIIGAENSHTAGFGKLFNIDKKFPGAEVKYVWGETDEFAKAAMKKGNIPEQVKDPKEMLGNIDALIVDHRHPKYHLEAAWPFVEAGVPTFVDKPFCYRASEGKDFLQMAKQMKTPVTSYSSIAQSSATFDMMKQIKSMDKISQVVRTGTADLDSKYGGIFFYGVHIVQPLMYMFGEDIEEVKVNRNGSAGNASLKFASGLFATLIFKHKAYGWETFVESGSQFMELKPGVEESDPPKNYADMVEMFKTGREPRSHQSILNCVSVLEALEKSAKTEKWTPVELLNV